MAEKKKTKATKKTAPKKKRTTKKAEPKAAKKRVAPKVEEVKVEQPPVQEVVKQPEVAKVVAVAPKPKKEKLPKGNKYYGTGRRKEATAKVWIKPGSGIFSVNAKPMSEYFCGRKVLEFQAARPLVVTNTQATYDVFAEVFGGGVPGQAGAVSMGIARALLAVSPDFRVKLKREGLLRRDPRMKERKKYGLKRARRAFQYTKR
jgi:small subunit ribosomal protein S9